MALTAVQQTRLEAIEEILAAGVSDATVSGRRVAYDLAQLRIERDELRALAIGRSGSRFRRVVLTDA